MAREVSWKPQGEHKLIGTDVDRLDGLAKSSGAARYTADINPEGTLFAKLLTMKEHGRARIVRLNVEPAKRIRGVHAVHVFKPEGTECRYDGELIAAVAAERPEIADDAVRAIEVRFEKLDHYVDDEDVKAAEQAERTASAGEASQGDVEAALKDAKAVHKGYYGIQVITHMCLEPHGSHCEWTGDDELLVHHSTQAVSTTGGQFAGPLGIDAANVTIKCDYMGGGFGSKFAADEWGLACARMAKEAGRPVRLMLDRATELKTGGNRPSGFAEVTIAADADGNIVAWDSHHWGSGGITGGTTAATQVPYVFDFENRNRKATAITTNAGPQRAWRAPSHPQACALTCTAIDDIAAKLEMDSLEVFRKNLNRTPRAEVYAEQMKVAADLIGWKDKWHVHGKGEKKGAARQGLGMALHTWGGRAGMGNCILKVHPDGTVESFGGTQDLGTGTRTVIAMTVADTFGLPVNAVKVHIGLNKYPQSGPSGGSTTVGGVTGPNRRAALEALWKIFDLVAEKFDVKADTLDARDQKIFSNGREVCTWKQAAALVGAAPMEVRGEGPKDDGLTDQGVGGVQMADVSVDTETGKVKINKFVAVQDCGLIVNMKLTKSQVYGAVIMGIAYALFEERIMDNNTGRFINADLENYKLARIGDIGEIVVEMYEPEREYKRGVIGIGEPPVISCGAAISNAVANALGVRVPVLPLTPKRVLDALEAQG